jgi:hypothetical protein
MPHLTTVALSPCSGTYWNSSAHRTRRPLLRSSGCTWVTRSGRFGCPWTVGTGPQCGLLAPVGLGPRCRCSGYRRPPPRSYTSGCIPLTLRCRRQGRACQTVWRGARQRGQCPIPAHLTVVADVRGVEVGSVTLYLSGTAGSVSVTCGQALLASGLRDGAAGEASPWLRVGPTPCGMLAHGRGSGRSTGHTRTACGRCSRRSTTRGSAASATARRSSRWSRVGAARSSGGTSTERKRGRTPRRRSSTSTG